MSRGNTKINRTGMCCAVILTGWFASRNAALQLLFTKIARHVIGIYNIQFV